MSHLLWNKYFIQIQVKSHFTIIYLWILENNASQINFLHHSFIEKRFSTSCRSALCYLLVQRTVWEEPSIFYVKYDWWNLFSVTLSIASSRIHFKPYINNNIIKFIDQFVFLSFVLLHDLVPKKLKKIKNIVHFRLLFNIKQK